MTFIFAVTVFSTYLAAGIISLFGQQLQKVFSIAVVIVLLIGSLLMVKLYIAPRYNVPKYIAYEEIPADMIVSGATFNKEIELVGYSVFNNTITTDDSLQVTLYWRGKSYMNIDYNLAINVYGYGMENIAKLDTWPGGGLLPTAEWAPDVIYPDVYVLPGQTWSCLYSARTAISSAGVAASAAVAAFVKYTLYDGPDALIANKLLEMGVTVNPNNVDWYKRTLIEGGSA